MEVLALNGIIFDIKRFAIHDGPGIRTTVFFKGCPLRCGLCHNPESQVFDRERLMREERCLGCGECIAACRSGAISKENGKLRFDPSLCLLCGACKEACSAEAAEIIGTEMTVGEVMKEIERDLVFFDESRGGVTISGGEPLAQPDFLERLLEACRALGIHRTVDTSGYVDEKIMDRIAEETDLFLYDLKLVDPTAHKRFTGVSNDLILRNLDALCRKGSAMVIRFPLIPGVNDDEENIKALGRLLSGLKLPVDVLPYHRAGLQKYARLGRDYPMGDTAPPSEEGKRRAAGMLKKFGLKVYLEGESHDPE